MINHNRNEGSGAFAPHARASALASLNCYASESTAHREVVPHHDHHRCRDLTEWGAEQGPTRCTAAFFAQPPSKSRSASARTPVAYVERPCVFERSAAAAGVSTPPWGFLHTARRSRHQEAPDDPQSALHVRPHLKPDYRANGLHLVAQHVHNCVHLLRIGHLHPCRRHDRQPCDGQEHTP